MSAAVLVGLLAGLLATAASYGQERRASPLDPARVEFVMGNLQFTPIAGANGVPTPANGVPSSYGPYFTIGATGRGAVSTANINQTTDGELVAGDVKYRYDDGSWRLESGLNASSSFWKRDNFKHGHFQQMNNALAVPVRVSFLEIDPTRPGRIEVFDNNNSPVDIYDINSYRGTTANDVPLHAKARMTSGFLNLRRQIDALPFLASMQIGAAYKRRLAKAESSGDPFEATRIRRAYEAALRRKV